MVLKKKTLEFVKYKVERLLIRGPFFQILFIGFIIVLISIIGGEVLKFIEPVKGGLSESAWWAFLRMSDPGYLGDDTGTAKRALATVLTLLGYVLFMGSLVAIMTQWLYRKMQQLEAGFTAITTVGHITILGYTTRTPVILNEILSSSGRLRRFLAQRGRRSTKVAILNPTIGYELSSDIQSHLDNPSAMRHIILRSGTPMNIDDLERVNVEQSSTIIIPAAVFGNTGSEKSDMMVIKALLSVRHRIDKADIKPPIVVAEILDEMKVSLAEKAYGENIRIISSHLFLSRMIAQNIQHPGLSLVFAELLSQSFGSEIYLKSVPSIDGRAWGSLRQAFEEGAIPIGVINEERERACLINPAHDLKLVQGDTIIFVADSFEKIKLKTKNLSESIESLEIKEILEKGTQKKKTLILGWNQKAPRLVDELLTGTRGNMEIDLMTVLPLKQRVASTPPHLRDLIENSVNHLEGDYTSLVDLKTLDLESYTNIIFLSSDWMSDNIEADARSLMGYLQLQECLAPGVEKPILVELADPENEDLFSKKSGEFIISPLIVSHILANVALRPDLSKVFDVLFYAEGPEISFISPKRISLSGDVSFEDISRRAYEHGMIAIGMINEETMISQLNPKKSRVYNNIEKRKVIVVH